MRSCCPARATRARHNEAEAFLSDWIVSFAGQRSRGPAAAAFTRRGPPPARARVPFWENVWVVLVMLLGVVGPLALPMLWRSRQFTLFWKIVLTVVVVAITALIVAVLYDYCQQMATSLNRSCALRAAARR